MPVFRPNTVKTKSAGNDDPCGAFTAQLFSDSGGLTQFGAFVEILPPSSSSAIKHWHANEDEMVYMIEGQATVYEGDTETLLQAGDAATFKAGVGVGHCIANKSDADVRYLVIGTRLSNEVVTYPDIDRVLRFTRDGDKRSNTWEDFAGNPATSAYDDLAASKD